MVSKIRDAFQCSENFALVSEYFSLFATSDEKAISSKHFPELEENHFRSESIRIQIDASREDLLYHVDALANPRHAVCIKSGVASIRHLDQDPSVKSAIHARSISLTATFLQRFLGHFQLKVSIDDGVSYLDLRSRFIRTRRPHV